MSESEEMYLITIATLCEGGSTTPVPLSLVASELSLQPVSVNQMVRKLEEAGWVNYVPYKGVELTTEGQNRALSVLRRRRLWEVFLVEKLSLSIEEADSLACRMEHISTRDVTDRLAKYLGDPPVSPKGKTIPSPQQIERTDVPAPAAVPLSSILIGATVRVAYTTGKDIAKSFLESNSIHPSRKITPLAQSDNGDVLLQTETVQVHLNADLVKAIFVIKE